jgi:hypothetical protein
LGPRGKGQFNERFVYAKEKAEKILQMLILKLLREQKENYERESILSMRG